MADCTVLHQVDANFTAGSLSLNIQMRDVFAGSPSDRPGSTCENPRRLHDLPNSRPFARWEPSSLWWCFIFTIWAQVEGLPVDWRGVESRSPWAPAAYVIISFFSSLTTNMTGGLVVPTHHVSWFGCVAEAGKSSSGSKRLWARTSVHLLLDLFSFFRFVHSCI